MFRRFLRSENQSENIQIELLMKMFLGDLLERQHFINARVIDQDVKRSTVAELLDEPSAIGRVGQVGGQREDARIVAPCRPQPRLVAADDHYVRTRCA